MHGRVQDFLAGCRPRSGLGLFEVREIGRSLHTTIRTSRKADIEASGFQARSVPAGFELWERAGIAMNEAEAGTAIPASEVIGILMEWASLVPAGEGRSPSVGTGSKVAIAAGS